MATTVAKKYFKMACTGLTTPYVKAAGQTNGFVLGNAVTLGVTASYLTASLYGDNVAVDEEDGFQSAAITAGSTFWPIEAASQVFGHEVDASSGQVSYGDDHANEIKYGVIEDGKAEGNRIYICDILTSVKLRESAETYNTRGESIAYVTPACEGTAKLDSNGLWRIRKPFDTLAEAIAYMKTEFAVS